MKTTFKKQSSKSLLYSNIQSSKFRGHYYTCCLVAKSCLSLLWPHGLQVARLLCPWNFPGKNPGVGCHFLLLEIFSTQGSNTHLLHWQADLPMSHQGNIIMPQHLNCQTSLFSWQPNTNLHMLRLTVPTPAWTPGSFRRSCGIHEMH